MSKLDELIKKLCPYGVEYKKLEDISTFERGKGFKKEDKGTGDSPIIFYGELYTTYGNYIDEIVSFVDEKKVANKIYVNKGDIVLPISSTTAEAQIGKASVVRVDRAILGSDAIVIHHNINSSYLMYYINSKIFEFYKMKCVSGTTIRHLAPKEMMQIKVAVPPLEVQCEIVHILDDFTLLSAELSAELKARQKQFNYYRSKVFEKYLSNMIELDTIGEVTKLAGFEFSKYVKYSENGNIIALRGLNVKDGKLILNDVKYIDNSDFSKLDRSRLYKDDILYTYVGTVGQVGLVDYNDKYYLAPNVARIRITDKRVLPQFVMYFLQTPEFKMNQLDKLSGSSSMKNITMTNIRKFKIPVPSIEEQEKIINVLERFDKLCNDISEGLPAEIEKRQKQYEYYRDKLLTFKELEVNE